VGTGIEPGTRLDARTHFFRIFIYE